MQKFYGLDPLQIYKTLYNAILIESEEDFGNLIKREPYNFDDISALQFVMNGFRY
jgi:hypothetical protein